MFIAKNQFIPPQNWMHNYNIKNKDDKTLKDILKENNLPVPLKWKYNKIYEKFNQACFRIIPTKDNCNAIMQNDDGFTIAMILTINDIKVPEEW